MSPARRAAFSPYREAQRAARRQVGTMNPATAARVDAALRRYADQVAAAVRRLGPGDARNATALTSAITGRMARELEAAIVEAVGDSRALAYSEVSAIYAEASAAAARAAGIPLATLGAVRVAPLSMLGAYDRMGGARTWRTLVQGHVFGAADAANRTVLDGLTAGVGPEELARRLRPYLTGSEPFHKVFAGDAFAELRNLRGMRGDLRDAAEKLAHNARRIAYSETHNARGEAEVEAFAFDPMVRAVQWELSPDRGSLDGPDICDALAESNYYGLGAGVYPVDAVPLPPHPWDRCERTPVIRPARDIGKPKPMNRTPKLGATTISRDLSDAARARIERLAAENIRASASAGAAIRRTLRQG